MNRRAFIQTLPAIVALTVAVQRKRKIQTVVQIVRHQQADGKWAEAWSEVKHPKGRKWTKAEIKKHGYKVIERELAQ